MAKKQLSLDAKKAIIQAKKRGDSDRMVASQFGVDHGTISRIYGKSKAGKGVKRISGSGRPRKTSERQDRAMVKKAKKDPKKTAVDVMREVNEEIGLDISKRTARRRLNEAGLFGRRPSRKPLISEANRKARAAFAKDHLHWTKEEWAKVLWSDESKFNLFSSDGVRYVRRPVGKRYDVRYQVPTVKHGGGSLMVWGKSVFSCSPKISNIQVVFLVIASVR
jgi:transposase